MTWAEVVAQSPFLSAFVLIVLICGINHLLLMGWSRTMRAFNIRKHGWPPAHCDADGDLLEMYREKTKDRV